MSIDAFKEDDDVIEEEVSESSGYSPLPSGIYRATVEAAYRTLTRNGGQAVNLIFKTDNGDEVKSVLYVTTRADKGGTTHYIDPKTGKKKILGDFKKFKDFTRLLLGKLPRELDSQKMHVKIYDYDQRKEVPEEVDGMPEFIGKSCVLAIARVVDNKRVQDDDGTYVPTADKRIYNEVQHYYDAEGFTLVERMAENEEPVSIYRWRDKYEGQDYEKYKPVAGNTSAAPAAAPKPATKPLFQ